METHVCAFIWTHTSTFTHTHSHTHNSPSPQYTRASAHCGRVMLQTDFKLLLNKTNWPCTQPPHPCLTPFTPRPTLHATGQRAPASRIRISHLRSCLGGFAPEFTFSLLLCMHCALFKTVFYMYVFTDIQTQGYGSVSRGWMEGYGNISRG